MKNKWTADNFLIYDADHPEIYEYFERFALEIAKYRKHFSAKCVFHRIRWETALGGMGEYKIDDGWISHYARKFALLNPDYEDLFEFRSRKNSYHAPEFALQP